MEEWLRKFCFFVVNKCMHLGKYMGVNNLQYWCKESGFYVLGGGVSQNSFRFYFPPTLVLTPISISPRTAENKPNCLPNSIGSYWRWTLRIRVMPVKTWTIIYWWISVILRDLFSMFIILLWIIFSRSTVPWYNWFLAHTFLCKLCYLL